jgi:hypothetical protein
LCGPLKCEVRPFLASTSLFVGPHVPPHHMWGAPHLELTPPFALNLSIHPKIKVGPPLMRGAPPLATFLSLCGPHALHLIFPLTKTLKGRPLSRSFSSLGLPTHGSHQGPLSLPFWYKRDPTPPHLIYLSFATVMLLKFHPTSLAHAIKPLIHYSLIFQ